MAAATDGFAERRKIDEGSFGAVYRGKLQPSGTDVAVKVLKPEAAAVVVAQKKHEQFVGVGGFHKELRVLSEHRHQNIVALLGYCLSGSGGGGGGGDDEDESKSSGGGGGAAAAAPGLQRQCLVLEWMAGGSLKGRLAASSAAAPMTAQQRFDVASDVARGLHYLHITASPPIIHQDVKSANILLCDVNGVLMAKVADFGTARFVPELLDGGTHHSTQLIIGTRPYQPQEYLQSGHASDKTDSYAFGVVLCELLTGEPVADARGSMLSARMYEPLENAEHELEPLLDKRLAARSHRGGGGGGGRGWPLPRAILLGRITRRCIEMVPGRRCTVAQVVAELDSLAGRMALRRAGRDEEYDGMTGQLVKKQR